MMIELDISIPHQNIEKKIRTPTSELCIFIICQILDKKAIF